MGCSAALFGPLSTAGPTRTRRVTAAAVLVVVALAVRTIFVKYETGDYATFYGWYEFIKQHGGLHALKYNFANYNEPYLYLLSLVSYTSLAPLWGIKLISVSFDIVLGYFTYRLVRLRYPEGWAPLAAAAIVLFLPTVVLNSALWAQIDASYSSLCLGGLYFSLRRRPWWACVFFGLALAFKLQAIFVFPLLALLVLRRWVPWRALLAIPAVFIVADVPAFALGASFSTLWKTYTGEVGLYNELTLNAPNIYQYLDITVSPTLRSAGIAATAVIVLALLAWATARRVELDATRIVLAAAVSAVLLPFLLPAMHERYFYLADSLTVISAFYVPRRLWPLPIIEQFASVMSYMPFILATTRTAGSSAGSTAGSTGGPATGTGAPPGNVAGGPGNPGGSASVGSLARSGGARPGPPGLKHNLLPQDNGIAGITSHAVISFPVLTTAMLLALVLVLWATSRQFRSRGPTPSAPAEALARPPASCQQVLHELRADGQPSA
ncbi:MAG TPA: glycosyltransferase 87 family protein [Acidimicrobiales bacterium]|nr:glycosyltransferase 87 family protein [Acidimicrobiales bacterium]